MAWERFVAGFDPHGSLQDPIANKAFFKFCKDWKPTIRVCGGDLWDMTALRRGASEEERATSLQADFEAGRDWLVELQATHFLRGNHDERLWDLREHHSGVMRDYANKAIDEVNKLTKSLGCTMLPYDRRDGVLKIGKLKLIHGFAAGVNAARRSAQCYGSVLMGHAHSIQHSSIEGLDNRVGRVCGCLCKLDLPYARANMGSLVWRHGWAYGVVESRTGDYHVYQAEEVNGKFIVSTGVKEL